MNPKITIEYPRTAEDYSAEKGSEEAAIDGKWAAFAGIDLSEEHQVDDIAQDALAKRIDERHKFADDLADRGWPNDMINHAVDRHYPLQ